MFRKLVSNVSFSPALVGQLGFYARRLKKEEATRRFGLVFTALALIVQSFVVFSPPEPANAASGNDMIAGGVSTISGILAAYDRDAKFRNVMNYVGITRTELSKTSPKTINNLSYGTGDRAWKSWGYQPRFSAAQGEVKHNANGTTVYSRPNHLFNSSADVKVFYGKSTKFGEFGIMLVCGNLYAPKLPPPPPPPPPPPAPIAECTSLTVIKSSDTSRRFTVATKLENGATVSGYGVLVTRDDGTTISNDNYTASTSTFTTPERDFGPGSYIVKATAKTSLGDKTNANCTAPFTVAKPGVSIEKTVNDTETIEVGLNETFTYRIVVKNTGGISLENVVVSDDTPAGITFESASAGTIGAGKWEHTLSQLPAGASREFTIAAKATQPAEPGETMIKNTACVETPTIGTSNPDDCDDATVTVPEATIRVCDLNTDKMVTIAKSELETSRYSENPDDCVRIQVCDKTTDTVVTIRKPELDESKHTTALSECDNIQVCELATGNVIVIARNDFDSERHSSDASDCVPAVAQSKTAINMTKGGQDATTVVASANDRIRYTVTTTNVGDVDAVAEFEEHIQDVLEYAMVIDTGGGSFNKDDKVLTWPSVTLKPGEQQSRLFTVQLSREIPAGARGVSDPSSYDCVMSNTFGENVAIDVACPVVKSVETVATELPETGASQNIMLGAALLAVVTYFYARSRQLGTEIRLIRRDLNSGSM